MVLVQTKTHRSVEQNREPRNKPMIIWSINFQQRRQKYAMGKKWSLRQMVLRKLDSCVQKNETGSLSHTIQNIKFKMDERPKCETGNHQNPA